MNFRRSTATITDYQQLCELAHRRGLAVELVVSDHTVGNDDLARRIQSRLRLVPRAARGAREIAGTTVHPDTVYEAARRLLERVQISGSAR